MDRPSGASVGPKLDAIWTKYHDQLVGLCVGAVDDRVSLNRCYGKKAPSLTAKPGVHTLFRIESVSKTFAAALLALRVQQHRVALADDVRRYVPGLLAGKPLYPSR